jgi:thiol-disulfide isomerase/thioredoxin
MKSFIFSALAFAFLAISCEEVPPTISRTGTTSAVTCEKTVLVEEFTGIKCTNCPPAAKKLKDIAAATPDKIVVVAIHSGFFAKPIDGFDLKTQASDDIYNYLGATQNPSAAINRKKYDNQSELVVSATAAWAGLMNDEYCIEAEASINITSSYNATDSTASITVDITPEGTVTATDPIAVTVMLTEDHIIGPQKYTSTTDSTYDHKHVLREFFTSNPTGDIITQTGAELTTTKRTYSKKIAAEYDVSNLNVVAFIHYKGASKKDVIVVKEIKL